MKITKKILAEQDKVIGLKCDHCLKEYEDVFELQEFIHINFIGGDASVFGDGYEYEADICQHCAKLLLGGSLKFVKEWD